MKRGRSSGRSLTYQQIADKIRKLIYKDFQPGDRLHSEKALAEQFAVSNLTIRQALTVLEQEGVLVKKQGSGSYVQEQVKASRHIAILSFLDLLSVQQSYFFRRLARLTQQLLTESDIPNRLYIGNCLLSQPLPDNPCEDFFYDVEMDRVAGVIVCNMAHHPRSMGLLQKAKFPIVGVGQSFNCNIEIDKPAFVADLITYLRERQCNCFAYLGHGLLGQTDRDALLDAGIRVPENLFINLGSTVLGEGSRALRRMMTAESVKPDWLFVADDMLWHDVLVELLLLGVKVPESLNVILLSHVEQDLIVPFPVTLAEFDIMDFATALVHAMKIKLSGRYNKSKGYLVPCRLRELQGRLEQ